MKPLVIVSFLVLSLLGLSACETMEGFGRDVQKVGENIEDGANGE